LGSIRSTLRGPKAPGESDGAFSISLFCFPFFLCGAYLQLTCCPCSRPLLASGTWHVCSLYISPSLLSWQRPSVRHLWDYSRVLTSRNVFSKIMFSLHPVLFQRRRRSSDLVPFRLRGSNWRNVAVPRRPLREVRELDTFHLIFKKNKRGYIWLDWQGGKT